MKKKKFFITTTVARTLFFFKGQPRLWKENFDVCAIAAEKDRLIEFAEDEGIRYKYMPMRREISLLSDFVCLLSFIWLFIKERPHIVHGNTPKASMLSMLAAWLTRRPVRIYMCHGLRYQTTSGFTLRLLKAMEWLSCHCATTIIGVSQGVVTQLVADGLCSKKKAILVGHGTAGGINTERFSREAIRGLDNIRDQLGISKEAFVFCFVGRIVKDKGINELVTAFNRLSQESLNTYLLLIGPEEKDLDPIDEKTKLLISKNKHIYAVGSQKDVRPWLAASDAFLLPSYREGVGQVLLEANAMDVPCITSDIIGCNDVVVPMLNGELVEPHNTDALYKKMREWMTHPDMIKGMALNCRRHILSHYSTNDVRIAYYKEYCRMIGIK